VTTNSLPDLSQRILLKRLSLATNEHNNSTKNLNETPRTPRTPATPTTVQLNSNSFQIKKSISNETNDKSTTSNQSNNLVLLKPPSQFCEVI
jgi:hypothetical protein